MSATIYFRPEPPKSGTALDIGGPSSFLESFANAFGDSGEWVLGREHVPVLHGLAAGLGGDQKRAVLKIHDALIEHGSVRVWSER
jgi:hypothetical protein